MVRGNATGFFMGRSANLVNLLYTIDVDRIHMINLNHDMFPINHDPI